MKNQSIKQIIKLHIINISIFQFMQKYHELTNRQQIRGKKQTKWKIVIRLIQKIRKNLGKTWSIGLLFGSLYFDVLVFLVIILKQILVKILQLILAIIIKKLLFLSKRKEKNFTEQGLSNIGNTCFLNSVLQLFYSIEHIRQKLMKKNKNERQKRSYFGIDRIIGQIFNKMENNNQNNRNKEQNLYNLLQKFAQINQLYNKYEQYDALQTLLILLRQICDQQELKNTFTVYSSFNCSCSKNEFRKESLILLSRKQICSQCLEQFKVKYFNFPLYLIVSNHNHQAPMKFSLSKPGQYDLVSFVRYRGTGKTGHYDCARKENGIFYSFNDNYVSKLTTIQDFTYKNMILLYKKVKR